MSNFEFKLPDIGEGVSEGEIVNWLVKVGDTVAQDQDMVEVMTDKATVTIGAPKAGRVAELRAAQGDVVPVGQVLVVLSLDGGAGAAPSKAETAAPAAAAPAAAPAKPAAAPVQET
ncbi:MAG TPA: biotin/lipoyl-containing protein, partial [Polyangiaceae bacterium]|nr:biotin/lipoyl-containing protein [Polyangiaceae bacterium]